jgi:hypothetical protein
VQLRYNFRLRRLQKSLCRKAKGSDNRRKAVGAGFPDAPRIMLPAGSAMRDLTVSGELRGRVLLPWYEAAEVPGYDRVFAILDGIVAEVSEGAIPAR